MADYNRVIMIGNLTRDPDLKTLASGHAVCRLGLASNRQFKNRQSGSLVQEVCYIDVDVWGAQAESCGQYLQKGRAVLIEGRLKYDTWEDANGQNRSKHLIVADRVVFLSQNLSSESGASVSSGQKDPSTQLEKDLLEQIDQIKERTARQDDLKSQPAKTVKTKKVSSKKNADVDVQQVKDVEFKDEPPFEDDLPF